MTLVKATSADHKQRFARIGRIKITAAFAIKALHPLITTLGNFQKFGYGTRIFHSTRRDDRNSAKWRAAEFLAIGAMTGNDLI